MRTDVLWVRRGHAPNCSATGVVVGAALLSAVAAAAVVNAFADRFARARRGSEPPSGEPAARVRPERFGALVALPGLAGLLAVSPDAAAEALAAGAERVGGGPAPLGALCAPIEVHVAVTERCPAGCRTCYLDARAESRGSSAPPDPDPEALEADLDALADAGVFEVALGGGEAVDKGALLALAGRIRARGMVPNLTTSGFGVDGLVAARMAEVFGQINVSVDGIGAGYRAVRGWDGSRVALGAIDRLVAAGARVGANTVLTRDNVGDLEALGRTLAARGVAEWQWLRLKPAGRAREGYADKALTREQASALWPRALAIEADTGLVLRWDCAMVPFLAEHQVPVEALQRLGVTGCPGGQSLLARTGEGRWAPCSFAAGAAERGPVGEVWAGGGALSAWRGFAAAPPEPCASCAYREVCRGGCRIVAGHHGDALAPDPECPRVSAWR